MKLAACQRFSRNQAPNDWAVEPIKKRICLEYGTNLIQQDRISGRFPVYGSNGQVGTHDAFCVEGPGILVGRKGSVGEVHYSSTNFWPIDTVYYVRRQKGDDWDYLYYLLGYLKLGLLNAATGVPGLTRRDAHEILGVFPPLPEQRRIAAVLRQADEAIDKAKAELEAARELKRALLRSLFAEGLHAPEGIRHSKWMASPAHWTVKPLRRFAAISSGFTMGRDLSKHETITIPYVTVVNVQDGSFALADIGQCEIKKEELETDLIRDGDILMTEGGDRDKLGRGGMWQGQIHPCGFQNHIFRVRLDADVYLPQLFHFLIQTHQARSYFYAHAKQTSNLCTINSRELKNWPVPIPPLHEQEKMVEILIATQAQESTCKGCVESLQSLKSSLLHSLLTGRLRVPEGVLHD